MSRLTWSVYQKFNRPTSPAGGYICIRKDISVFSLIYIIIILLTYLSVIYTIKTERGDFMDSIRSAIENTVSISLFNRGLQGKFLMK